MQIFFGNTKINYLLVVGAVHTVNSHRFIFWPLRNKQEIKEEKKSQNKIQR